MAMSWRPKTASALLTLGLARRVVNVLSTYVGATLTKMTLVPNSSLGIQNTSSLRTRSSHLRVPTARDPNRPHVVDSRTRIDQRWLITVRSLRMENLRAESLDPKSCLAPDWKRKPPGKRKQRGLHGAREHGEPQGNPIRPGDDDCES